MQHTWLAHPLTRGLLLDDPQTTYLRRQIIRKKKFLRLIYEEWYASILAALPDGPEPVLELGSGAGFFKEFLPDLITSEIFWLPGMKMVLDGQELPLASGVLRGLVMINVLHHLSRPRCFFAEAARCLKPNGVLVMFEPWVTAWSRLIYGKLHHEPFWPGAATWEFPSQGPLSGANAALPWIIFARDRAIFAQEFPQLQVRKLDLSLPLRYLLSGGMSGLRLSPAWSFHFWRRLEGLLQPYMSRLAMFARIEVVKISAAPEPAGLIGEKSG
jgi:SAM-dependent methyltransferase